MSSWIDAALWQSRNACYVEELRRSGLIEKYREASDRAQQLERADLTATPAYAAALAELSAAGSAIASVERRHNYLSHGEYPWLPGIAPVSPIREGNEGVAVINASPIPPPIPEAPDTVLLDSKSVARAEKIGRMLRAFDDLRVSPRPTTSQQLLERCSSQRKPMAKASAEARSSTDETSWTALVDAARKKPAKAKLGDQTAQHPKAELVGQK